jgi:hypothetical protein
MVFRPLQFTRPAPHGAGNRGGPLKLRVSVPSRAEQGGSHADRPGGPACIWTCARQEFSGGQRRRIRIAGSGVKRNCWSAASHQRSTSRAGPGAPPAEASDETITTTSSFPTTLACGEISDTVMVMQRGSSWVSEQGGAHSAAEGLRLAPPGRPGPVHDERPEAAASGLIAGAEDQRLSLSTIHLSQQPRGINA